MPYSVAFLVLFALRYTYAYDFTTTFDSILLAHPSPTICPTFYSADVDYVVCCPNKYWTNTKTTAKGPGGSTMYACCVDGATCTGAAPFMSDWSLDNNGDLQTKDLATPPTPTPTPTTPAANPAVTTPTLNLGTVSSPGATPYTTQPNGVVIYNNINTGDNNNNNGSINQNKNSGSLTGGAIAGITVACAVVGTVFAGLSVWYARRQARNRRLTVEIEQAGKPEPQQNESSTSPSNVYSPPVVQAHVPSYGRVELAGQCWQR